MRHITLITNKPYFTILLFSLIISIPVSQVLVKNYLDQVNAFHVPVDLRVIVPSTMVILLTIFLTIGVNLIKIAKARPTDTLKDP